MLFSLNLWSLNLVLLTCLACCSNQKPFSYTESEKILDDTLITDSIAVLSDDKLKMTLDYCEKNYGFRDYKLNNPQMIVVHHTVIPTLEQTLALFRKDSLATNRQFINKFSVLNVGIHYVVDPEGRIYKLLPDTVIARHIIGFNHVSLGIENVAASASDLTKEQLKSNARLINRLASVNPSIQYLIGHDEYNDTSLPHYQLFRSLNAEYQPYDKPDPGESFMSNLRALLKSDYALEFKD